MNTKVMKRELQMKRRKARIRKVVTEFILFIIMITIFVISFVNWLNGDIPVNYEGEYTTYTVSKGERLWNIAEKVSSNKDVREVVYIIEKDNNLDSANLHIGQELKIRNEY